MKLEVVSAPHIKTKGTAKKMIGDVIVALLPLCFMAYYYYGSRTSVIIGMCALLSWGLDRLLSLLRPHRFIKADFSAVVTGMMIALLMPASVPLWLPAACCVFAIAIAKHPFGGFGNNPFNPAIAAVAFALVSFPTLMTQYPTPLNRLDFSGEWMAKLQDSSAAILQLGGIPSFDEVEVLLGKQPGPMGVTNILVITACLIFLLVRKTAPLGTVSSFLGICALLSLLHPRAVAGTGISSLFFELTSGSLFFCGVFALSDPVTTPNTRTGRVLFGALCGGLTMLLRWIGAYEEGVFFAILLMNSLSGFLDRTAYLICRDPKRFFLGRGRAPAFPHSQPDPPRSVLSGDGPIESLQAELEDPLEKNLEKLDREWESRQEPAAPPEKEGTL